MLALPLLCALAVHAANAAPRRVEQAGRIRFVDDNGRVRFTLPSRFNVAGDFHDGLASVGGIEVVRGGATYQYGFVDTTGKLVISQVYDAVEAFAGGYARVRQRTGQGLIDRKGAVVVPLRFTQVDEPGGTIVRVRGRGGFGFVRIGGAVVAEPRFASALPFSEGLAAVSEDGQAWGFLDEAGNMLSPRFQRASSFSEGLAYVVQDGAGYVDRTGAWAVTPQKEWTPLGDGAFHEGRVVVIDEEEHRGFVDRAGRWVVAPTWTGARPFENGVAVMRDDSGLRLVSPDGELVSEQAWDWVGPWQDGTATAFRHGTRAQVGTDGRVTWEGPPGAGDVTEEIVERELRLEVVRPPTRVRRTEQKWTVRVVNMSPTRWHRVIRPGDGSSDGRREPHFFITAEVPDAGGWRPVEVDQRATCGLFDFNWQRDVVWLGPGKALVLAGEEWRLSAALPVGRVRVRWHYAFGNGTPTTPEDDPMLGTPEFQLDAAPVELDVRE